MEPCFIPQCGRRDAALASLRVWTCPLCILKRTREDGSRTWQQMGRREEWWTTRLYVLEMRGRRNTFAFRSVACLVAIIIWRLHWGGEGGSENDPILWTNITWREMQMKRGPKMQISCVRLISIAPYSPSGGVVLLELFMGASRQTDWNVEYCINQINIFSSRTQLIRLPTYTQFFFIRDIRNFQLVVSHKFSPNLTIFVSYCVS